MYLSCKPIFSWQTSFGTQVEGANFCEQMHCGGLNGSHNNTTCKKFVPTLYIFVGEVISLSVGIIGLSMGFEKHSCTSKILWVAWTLVKSFVSPLHWLHNHVMNIKSMGQHLITMGKDKQWNLRRLCICVFVAL